MTYYKILNDDLSCYHGGQGSWQPIGQWMPPLDAKLLELCYYGYHILERKDVIYWLGPAIFEVEVPDTARIVYSYDKLVVSQARLVRKLETWNAKTQRLFAADCAGHVLPLYEKAYPNDPRLRLAIQATRDFAQGLIIQKALYAAYAAAADAAAAAANAAYAAADATNAADAATHAAADAANAAANAAYAAADAAYTAAAADAAYAATRAAANAAYAAYAAYAATRAANAAADMPERQWQTTRLFEYLLSGDVL